MARAKTGKTDLIQKTQREALARSKARLADLVALIRRKLTAVVEGFYDIGEALQEIVEKKLYAAAGHASLRAFLAAEGLMSHTQADTLMAIVRRVPREEALRLGQERAFALVAYTEATPALDSPAGLLKAGARIADQPVGKASVRAIRTATRAVKAANAASRPPTAAERARAKARTAIERAVKKALRAAGLGRADVAVARDAVRITLALADAERLVART